MIFSATLAALLASAAPPAGIPDGYKPLYDQSFATPDALGELVFRDPSTWKHGTGPDGGFLELAYDVKAYKPTGIKYRSPFHVALVAGTAFTDFVMDLDMQSTVKPYGHQDMVVVWGFQSPERFYYCHLAVATDPHAHNVFIVNDAERVKISTETTKGITWKAGGWNHVRVTRTGQTGEVAVYFDDMTKPVMRAKDATFGAGHVGFGSFDDTGRVRNVKVYGPSAEAKKVAFYKPFVAK